MIPMSCNSLPLKKHKPLDEVWVWLCAAGLTVALVMIIGLLGLVVQRGLNVFWPKSVAVIKLADNQSDAAGAQRTIGGIIHGSRATAAARSQGRKGEREWFIQMGNRERYGVSFRYIPFSDVAAMEFPSDAIVVERTEYGPAIGLPVEVSEQGAAPIPADSPEFGRHLNAVLENVRALRRSIRHLEKDVIGKINFQMEKIRLQTQEITGHPSKPEKRVRLVQQREALERQYAQAAQEVQRLREELRQIGRLRLRLFDGNIVELPLGDLWYAHFPNRMSRTQKWAFFVRSLVRFVTDEPREANTEGGIFPALFGTFCMTLLMSIAVLPFGVLAAIYLREYARPGLLLRLVQISVHNLAGVPSIVFGVFGLGFFVYTVGGVIDHLFYSAALPTPTFGTGGILWASLTLALLTVPVVIVATEEGLAAVPRNWRDGSVALGATKWQTIHRVVLPAAAPGIMTGLILAMARGAGEVAPLMLVGVVKLAPSLPVDGQFPFIHLDRKFMHLAFHIYDLGFQSPDSDAAQPMVFATTLALILLVLVLNLGALIVREKMRRKYAFAAF